MTDKTNPFLTTVSHYSDKRLLFIIDNPNDFAPKLAEAAKYETQIRNLREFDEKVIANNDKDFEKTEENSRLTIVRQNLGFGASIEDCEVYLLNEGLNKSEVLEILDKAVELGPLKKEIKIKKSQEKNEPSIWMILITIFFVVRLIMRLAS